MSFLGNIEVYKMTKWRDLERVREVGLGHSRTVTQGKLPCVVSRGGEKKQVPKTHK